MRLGLISDTHGLLRPEAVEALRGVDATLHAGDVGHPDVLEGLRALAPVHAVGGEPRARDRLGRAPIPALPPPSRPDHDDRPSRFNARGAGRCRG